MEYHGIFYNLHDIILYGFQEDDLPVFGKIFDILLVKQTPFLCVQLFSTNGMDHHYNSYVLQLTDSKEVVPMSDQHKYFNLLNPMQSHSVPVLPGTIYIVTKYHILHV